VSRILIAAGASGGHVYPGLATAEVLRERGYEVSFVGGDRLEAKLVPEAGFTFHPLVVRRPPSVRIELLTPRGLRALASIAGAVFKARRLLRRVDPDVVLGMGGFAAVPVAIAARGRNLVLHEQNARLSVAQRVPMRWARVLALGFPLEDDVGDVRTVVVGLPIRKAIAGLAELDDAHRESLRGDARRRLGLDPSLVTVLVMGGSLGSGPLNDLVPRITLPDGAQVLHLAGTERDGAVRDAWRAAGRRAVVLPYLEGMQDAYLSADVVVARSGASSVAEFALAGLPQVLVPLPTLKRGDQDANARVAERAGAAVIVPQSDPAFVERVSNEVTALLTDEARRRTMGSAARSIAKPRAAAALADLIGEIA
jgi:UDP-N-acetylglucosamine--N-acetylmuramyl-(pentapeptide) pyrophosphoryl-undecaprenol N-acetylglucosamine transferase